MRFSLHLLATITALSRTCLGSLAYQEQLLLRPLPQNALLASFKFKSNSSSSSFDQQNFRYFPRSLGQILQHAHTKELHLRFSLGRWDAESWGARPWDGTREGGTGVELWAWVESKIDDEANARWLTLTNALSGLFCASLNFIDSTKTIRPVMTFEPEGIHPTGAMENLQLLHGTLPHEVVCTENLTPFLKLLPCKGKAGISSLLDGHKLFDAAWQTMAIDIRPICEPHGECILEIEHTVDMVLDIERSKRPRDNPIPRPLPIEQIECDVSKPYHGDDSCFPLHKSSEPAWSIAEVFGRSIQGSCTLREEETDVPESVCVNVPAERTVDVLSNSEVVVTTPEEELRCFKLPSNGTEFDLSFPEQGLNSSTKLVQPPFYAARSITGYGQERGGIQAVILNPFATESISLVYLESLPWYMKPYLHTLRATLSPQNTTGPTTDPIQEIYYRPALDRHRGTHLELLLTMPPSTTLTLTYDFEKAILRYTEYPPDANRGFDVAPAVIRLLHHHHHHQQPPFTNHNPSTHSTHPTKNTYLRTTSLLLPLPTPDFSMPYNVIILTSTVMALGFGSIFNLLVRRLVAADEVGPAPFAVALWAVRGRLGGVVRRWKDGVLGKRGKAE